MVQNFETFNFGTKRFLDSVETVILQYLKTSQFPDDLENHCNLIECNFDNLKSIELQIDDITNLRI